MATLPLNLETGPDGDVKRMSSQELSLWLQGKGILVEFCQTFEGNTYAVRV